jgi:hypothetical protein
MQVNFAAAVERKASYSHRFDVLFRHISLFRDLRARGKHRFLNSESALAAISLCDGRCSRSPADREAIEGYELRRDTEENERAPSFRFLTTAQTREQFP